MLTYKRFVVIFYVLSIPLFIGLNVIIDELMQHLIYNKNQSMLKKCITVFNNQPIDAVFFGDSVLSSYADNDQDKAGIDIIISNKTKINIFRFDHYALSPIVAKDYVKIFSKTKYKPKVVIFYINLRSFSDQWFISPSYNFIWNQIMSQYYSGRYYSAIIGAIKYQLTNEYIDKTIYENHNVIYGNLDLGKIKDIEKKCQIYQSIPEESGNKNILLSNRTKLLTLTYQFNYMNIITKEHKMLEYIKEMITELRKSNCNIIVYITPINYEEGNRYIGDNLHNRVRSNANTIINAIRIMGIDPIDMSLDLNSKYFCGGANEHLNYEGRKYVAEKLSAKIIESVSSAH